MQVQAAVRLEALASGAPGSGTRNAAWSPHVKVLAEINHPDVRTAEIRGLAGIWDYDLMPQMLEPLDDNSLQLSIAAGTAVEALRRRGLRRRSTGGEQRGDG